MNETSPLPGRQYAALYVALLFEYLAWSEHCPTGSG